MPGIGVVTVTVNDGHLKAGAIYPVLEEGLDFYKIRVRGKPFILDKKFGRPGHHEVAPRITWKDRMREKNRMKSQ